MKRTLTLILVFICVLPIVYSQEGSSVTIKDAINQINDELTGEDKLFYIFNRADEGAFIAVLQLFQPTMTKNNLVEQQIVKSTEDEISSTDLQSRNVVVFGGPCANRYWSEFSDETCETWSYEPGQSVVKVVDNDGYLALLIAGTDLKDTMEIARLVIQYNIKSELNQNSYLYSSASKRFKDVEVKCEKDFQCLPFLFNAEFTYKKGDYEYAITLTDLDEKNNLATFYLNGDPHSLELGESITENGITITPYEISYDPITTKPRWVQIHFSESMEGFKSFNGPVYLQKNCMKTPTWSTSGFEIGTRQILYLFDTDNTFDGIVHSVSGSTVDMTLNGKRYSRIRQGDTLDTIGGYRVYLDEILTDSLYDTKQIFLCFE